MPKVIDAKVGDEYSIVEPGMTGCFRFIRTHANGAIVLQNLDSEEHRIVSYEQFSLMRGRGSATRTKREGIYTATQNLGPFFILDPDDPKLTKTERKRRTAERKRYQKARTLHFYVTRFDQTFGVTTYETKLNRFLQDTYPDALQNGFEWLPSASALRRALRYGKPGLRPLGLFLETLGRHKKSKWPPWVDGLKNEMIALYWRPNVSQETAVAFFVSRFEEERLSRDVGVLKRPQPRTLREWLVRSETRERYADKYGSRNAHKRFVGTTPQLAAVRPLEYVYVDQTLTDTWFLIKDGDGNVVSKERAWLVYAVDAYSRMVLSANLTFEPPSVHTLLQCIKGSLKPKEELISDYGHHKGATDGWGKALHFVLDNAMENIGVSLQHVMQSIGSDIQYAALGTPEHKAYVERIFGTTNSLWHQLPGGRPGGKDKTRSPHYDARDYAELTLDEGIRRLQQYMVTVYHVEPSSGIGMAPARKWKEGVEKFGRDTIDDIKLIDGIFGNYARVLLTTSGIRFQGERYHDPVVVTRLIRDLQMCEKRRHRRGQGQTMVLRVSATYDPMDCSYINVVNEYNGTIVRVPNVHPNATEGMSFEVSKRLRIHSGRKNEEFHSEEERMQARRRLYPEAERSLKQTSKPSRQDKRAYYSEQRTFAPQYQIIEDEVDPSVNGMENFSISTTAPVAIRRNHGVAPKGPSRGRRKVSSRQDTKNFSRADSSPEAFVAEKPAVARAAQLETPAWGVEGSVPVGLSDEAVNALLDTLAENKSGRW